jgi:hypothetical protein
VLERRGSRLSSLAFFTCTKSSPFNSVMKFKGK